NQSGQVAPRQVRSAGFSPPCHGLKPALRTSGKGLSSVERGCDPLGPAQGTRPANCFSPRGQKAYDSRCAGPGIPQTPVLPGLGPWHPKQTACQSGLWPNGVFSGPGIGQSRNYILEALLPALLERADSPEALYRGGKLS